MKKFFVSDVAFGSPLWAKKRGFDSVEIMNQTILQKWNSVVSDDDMVFSLGNLALDHILFEQFNDLANGQIINVYTHNLVNESYIFEAKNANIAQGVLIVDDVFLLSYFPLADYYGDGELFSSNLYQVYGYSRNVQTDFKLKRINCMLDLWNLAPVSVSDLLDIMPEIS